MTDWYNVGCLCLRCSSVRTSWGLTTLHIPSALYWICSVVYAGIFAKLPDLLLFLVLLDDGVNKIDIQVVQPIVEHRHV